MLCERSPAGRPGIVAVPVANDVVIAPHGVLQSIG